MNLIRIVASLSVLAACLLQRAVAVDTDITVGWYTLDPNTSILQGDLNVKNLAYQKSVTVYYKSITTGWSTANNVTASYSNASPNTPTKYGRLKPPSQEVHPMLSNSTSKVSLVEPTTMVFTTISCHHPSTNSPFGTLS
ncbi:hypothetical protein BC829DRAFT_448528 [Chytridium lagenaria]|nr:hypothetical protein BC829DRAFT_448528 [Chytridium lagenaria]